MDNIHCKVSQLSISVGSISAPTCRRIAHRGQTATETYPLLQSLLPRKEFHNVLQFCTFDDVLELKEVGIGCQLSHLRHLCEQQILHLTKELVGAAMWNELEKMQALFRYKVPASIIAGSDDNGALTPLSAAAMRGNYTAVELLLQAGAYVNWADECGVTALEMAQTRFRYQAEMLPLDDKESSLWKTMEILKRHGGRIGVNVDDTTHKDVPEWIYIR